MPAVDAANPLFAFPAPQQIKFELLHIDHAPNMGQQQV